MKRKIDVFCCLAYGAIGISVYSDLFRKDVVLTIWKIIGISLELMFFYVMLWNVSFFVGHLSAHIYYKKEGLGDSPVVFFPFVFSDGKSSHLFYDLYQMANYFYPSEFFLDNRCALDKDKLTTQCLKGQKANFAGQIIFWSLYTVLWLTEKNIWFSISGVLSLITVIMAGWLKTDSYHGYFVRKKYMEEGYVEVYLARFVLLYTSAEHELYRLLETQMCTDFKEDFEFFYLEAVLHMYTAKCADKEFPYPDKIQDILYEKCFLKSIEDYMPHMEIADTKLSIMKMCLYYALVEDELGLKNVLKGYLEDLHWQQNQSFLNFDSYQKLLDLSKEDVLKDCSFFRKNQFYSTFTNYENVFLQIQNKGLKNTNVHN